MGYTNLNKKEMKMIDKLLLKIGWKKRDYYLGICWDTTEIMYDLSITLFLIWVGMAIKAM